MEYFLYLYCFIMSNKPFFDGFVWIGDVQQFCILYIVNASRLFQV